MKLTYSGDEIPHLYDLSIKAIVRVEERIEELEGKLKAAKKEDADLAVTRTFLNFFLGRWKDGPDTHPIKMDLMIRHERKDLLERLERTLFHATSEKVQTVTFEQTEYLMLMLYGKD